MSLTATPTPRITILCRQCGGNDVSRDAWADWDANKQCWVLRVAFDAAHCHDCDEEVSLEERRVWDVREG